MKRGCGTNLRGASETFVVSRRTPQLHPLRSAKPRHTNDVIKLGTITLPLFTPFPFHAKILFGIGLVFLHFAEAQTI